MVEVQKPMVFAISKVPARPSAGIGVVQVPKLEVFCDFCGARATLCGDRRGRGVKTHGFLRFLKFPRDPLRGSAWSRCKNPWFFAISKVPARPSAGIGVVQVPKLKVFCDFCGSRATLCGDRRGRGVKTHGFLRFLKFPRDPLRGSAWSRCKNPWFFAISIIARPSAGIGGRGAKLKVFCDFCGARATLCGDRRGRGVKTHGFLRFLKFPRDPLWGSAWSRCKNPWFFAISKVPARPSAWSRCKNSRFFASFVVGIGPRELSRGSRACSRNRRVLGSIPPWSAGGRRKMQLAF